MFSFLLNYFGGLNCILAFFCLSFVHWIFLVSSSFHIHSLRSSLLLSLQQSYISNSPTSCILMCNLFYTTLMCFLTCLCQVLVRCTVYDVCVKDYERCCVCLIYGDLWLPMMTFELWRPMMTFELWCTQTPSSGSPMDSTELMSFSHLYVCSVRLFAVVVVF